MTLERSLLAGAGYIVHDHLSSDLETTKGFGAGRFVAMDSRLVRQMKEVPDALTG
jgi:hypothetical protein